jgi:hypothetical protein
MNNKCICRCNNFNLCNRNINANESCRYHKNIKNMYIHKILYNVLKDKKNIDVRDLYEIYKYINFINYSNIKELYIEVLKTIPYKILRDISFINNNKYSSKMDKYNKLYDINKNSYDIECSKNIDSIIKLQKKFREKYLIKYDPHDNTYMNTEDLFTGDNISDISHDRLFVLKNNRGEKYIFDAIEFEYFIRTCIENNQEPYNPYNREPLTNIIINNLKQFIKYHNLKIKEFEYKWETNMHAFTDLAIEIERRGFYNSPTWFNELTNVDFLKIIKYFKMLSNNIPENENYFNNITEENLIFDFCKNAIKLFKECNEELYILCCNFIKSVAMCSNNFYENIPLWLTNGTVEAGVNGPVGAIIRNIGSIRYTNNILNRNIDTLMGMINRNSIAELENNFLLYYFVEYS